MEVGDEGAAQILDLDPRFDRPADDAGSAVDEVGAAAGDDGERRPLAVGCRVGGPGAEEDDVRVGVVDGERERSERSKSEG